jgi:hypothetical protein
MEQLRETRVALRDLARMQFGLDDEKGTFRSLQAIDLVDQLIEAIDKQKSIPHDASVLRHVGEPSG